MAVRIDWAIPCRYCEVTIDESITIVGGGGVAFYVDEFPTEVGCYVALKISAPEHEIDQEHVFKSQVLDPRMDPVPGTEREIPFMPYRAPSTPPGWEGQELLSTFHTFDAAEEGAYVIDLAIEERHTTIPIMVQLMPDEDEDEDANA